MTTTGSTTLVINRPPLEVWSAIADITRMGEWSPECIAGRWKGGATAPVVGAEFEGDNIATLGKFTLKRWTTTSAVTACEPGACFEFSVEGTTIWRYVFEAVGSGTQVTETFSYEAKGLQGFVYGYLLARPRTMTKGMQRTLQRLKTTLEATR